MKGAVVNVGAENGYWIVFLSIFGGGFAIILAGLIAGKSGKDMYDCLFVGTICMLLESFVVGWLLAIYIGC